LISLPSTPSTPSSSLVGCGRDLEKRRILTPRRLFVAGFSTLYEFLVEQTNTGIRRDSCPASSFQIGPEDWAKLRVKDGAVFSGHPRPGLSATQLGSPSAAASITSSPPANHRPTCVVLALFGAVPPGPPPDAPAYLPGKSR
jgi:hypothetical protein